MGVRFARAVSRKGGASIPVSRGLAEHFRSVSGDQVLTVSAFVAVTLGHSAGTFKSQVLGEV